MSVRAMSPDCLLPAKGAPSLCADQRWAEVFPNPRVLYLPSQTGHSGCGGGHHIWGWKKHQRFQSVQPSLALSSGAQTMVSVRLL